MRKKSREKGKSREKEIEGFAFVAPLMIGLALGLLFGRPDVGIIGGIGFGFLISLIIKLKMK